MIFSKSFDLLGWPLFSAISFLSHFPWRVLGLNITLFAIVSASSSSSQSYLRIQTDISFPEANTSVKRNWCLFQIWVDRKILGHLLSTHSESSTKGTLHVSLLTLRTISLRIQDTEPQHLTEATELWAVGLVPVHGLPPDGSLASAAGSAETPITATLTSSPNATKPSWLPPGWGQGFSTVSRVQPSRSSHGSSNPAPPTSGQTDRRTGSSWGFWGSSAPGAGTWLPQELCVCVEGWREKEGGEGSVGNQATQPVSMEDVPLSPLLACLCGAHWSHTANLEAVLCDQATVWFWAGQVMHHLPCFPASLLFSPSSCCSQ